jgi:hypothetical protein
MASKIVFIVISPLFPLPSSDDEISLPGHPVFRKIFRDFLDVRFRPPVLLPTVCFGDSTFTGLVALVDRHEDYRSLARS